MKTILAHGALLLVSSALAFTVWSRDEKAEKEKPNQVQVWEGSVDAVQGVSFDGKQRKLKVEAKKDALGRYYAMHLEKEETPPAPKPNPSAGVSAPPPEPKHESSYFLGVKAADETVAKLATLKALRALGKIDPARLADYGLDKPEATLKVNVGGKEQTLSIGGQTPGGGERYAKYAGSGEVFAIDGDLVQTLSFADSRLMERELHGFTDDEVKRVRITKGSKARELVRVPDKKDAWADAATPAKADETAVNWMTKLDRLRTTEFVEKPANSPSPEQALVRVEFFSGSKSLGFFELYKAAAEKEYLGRSEYTRSFVKVPASAAESLDQDLAALLK